ncbi:MAG TPA: DNA/RNA non-specific endonuclease [Polyangia bacterium]|nr:DNA/RNA non-specific endonuclease [Polyangia bacterium]
MRAQIFFLVLFAAGAAASTSCVAPPPAARIALAPPPSANVNLALGEPRDGDPSDDVLLDHGVFVASYDPARLVPSWVAWRLVAEDLGEIPRRDHFHPDSTLPAGLTSPRPRDYVGSGYDKGHLCPSGDRTASVESNDETFVMTNVEPQIAALNRGPWEKLEEHERHLATEGRQVFVVAGGLFDAEPKRLPSGEAVPRANYKILVVLDRGRGAADVDDATPVTAVIMPNSNAVAHTSWCDHVVSIDEIERQSGYDFLALMPEAVQRRIEARVGDAGCATR